MGGVLSIWPNALADIRGQVKADRQDLMYRAVRLGVAVGFLYHLYCSFYCIYYGNCQRGFNIFFLAVLICQSVIFYVLIPPLLLLTYLVKYAIRNFASAAVRSKLLTIGMEVNQFFGGLGWSFLLMRAFEAWKDASACMRRHDCDTDSYFSSFEYRVDQICSGPTCTDFLYNLPWIPFTFLAHYFGTFVEHLWSDALPPGGGEGDPPAGNPNQADPNSAPPAVAPEPAPSGPADPPGDGSTCSANAVAAVIRAWIEEAIQEILKADEKRKRRRKSRSKKRRSKSRKRDRKCD